ncbi:fatty acyl-AMP ligase [Lentzea sp. NPDC004789]
MEDLVSLYRARVDRTPAVRACTFVFDPAVDAGAHHLTYLELDQAARRTATWLREHCAPGSRVLLLHAPGLDFPASFLGCLYAGMIAVPSSRAGRFSHEQRRLTAIARDAAISAVLTDSAGMEDTAKWLAGAGIQVPCAAADALLDQDDVQLSPGGDAIAMLQYTSGSTGTPKGVVVRHRNLVANVGNIVRTLGLAPHQRLGGWIPLHHDMGLIGLMLPGLLRTAGYVQMDPMSFLRRPFHWLRMIDTYDVGGTAAPDFGYDLCVRRISDDQLAELDLSRLTTAVCGSEPVRPRTVRAFAERFAPAGFRPDALVPMYGLAESTLMVTGRAGRPPLVTEIDADAVANGILRPGNGKELVSCGRPQDTELRIVDPATGTELPEGRIGEICLSGPSVTTGYWNRGEFGPFLRTGDLGGVLHGEVYVTGRLKDVMVLHGRNVHPHDVEQELRMCHGELEGLHGAVFSVPDPERPVVVHEVRARWGAERLSELASAIRQTVAREFGAAPGVVLVRPGSVRRTTSGKVQRSAMRELFLRGELDPLAAHL